MKFMKKIAAMAAATAVAAVSLVSIRNKKSYAYVEYWKAFKSNFKKSTLAFIVWLIPAAFLVAVLYPKSSNHALSR